MNFILTLQDTKISSSISFDAYINWWVWKLDFDYHNSQDVFDIWQIVTVNDDKWKLIYRWEIVEKKLLMSSTWDIRNIGCFGLQTKLRDILYTNGTVTDDPANIIKDIIWIYNATVVSELQRPTVWVIDYWSDISIEFDNDTLLSALNKVIENQENYIYFWWDGSLVYKPYATNPVYNMNIWNEVSNVNLDHQWDSIINSVDVKYDWWTVTVEDATSISTYGKRKRYVEDTQIKNSATAIIRWNAILQEYSEFKERTTATINNQFETENLTPWTMISIGNTKQDLDNKIIKRVTYSIYNVSIELEEYETIEKVISQSQKQTISETPATWSWDFVDKTTDQIVWWQKTFTHVSTVHDVYETWGRRTNRIIRVKNNSNNGGVNWIEYADADWSVVWNRQLSTRGYLRRVSDWAVISYNRFITLEYDTYDWVSTYTARIRFFDNTHFRSGRLGQGINEPLSPFHSYMNNWNTGADATGMIVEQDGSGDATIHFLLTAIRRWIMWIDHSDGGHLDFCTWVSGLWSAGRVMRIMTNWVVAVGGKIWIWTDSPSQKLVIEDDWAEFVAMVLNEKSWTDSHWQLRANNSTDWTWWPYNTFSINKWETYDPALIIDTNKNIDIVWDINWQEIWDSWRITPTLLNSRNNYDAGRNTAQYRKIWNILYIKWMVEDWTNTQIMTLPTWYRPTLSVMKVWLTDGTSSQEFSYRLEILSTGEVHLRWTTGNRASIECSFIVS